MREVIAALDACSLLTVNERQFILNPLTEQVPFTSSELLKDACEELSKLIPLETTKLVTEEDKGAILVAGVSLMTGLPFGMARWYPNQLTSQAKEPFVMEYVSTNLYLNGVEKGDKVTIVDDMISTGGTLVALIKSIRKTGAQIQGVICVAEKLGYGGREKVFKETGIEVQTLVTVDVSGKRSKVLL